jgi:hypothetical protein
MDRVQYCKGGEEMKEYDDVRTLAQIYMLQDARLSKEQLESVVVSLLQHIYGNNEEGIVDYLYRIKEVTS